MNIYHDQTDMLYSLIGLLIIAGLTAYYASRKGKNPLLWFVFGCLIGVIAPLILFFLTFLEKSSARNAVAAEKEEELPLNPLPIANTEENRESVQEKFDTLWYYLDEEHQQIGPVSLIAIRELWHTGRLNLTSYVWAQGMPEWQKIEAIPELIPELNKIHSE